MTQNVGYSSDDMPGMQKKQAWRYYSAVAVLTWGILAIWKAATAQVSVLSDWRFWIFALPFGYLSRYLGVFPYLVQTHLVVRLVNITFRSPDRESRIESFAAVAGWALLGFTVVWVALVGSLLWRAIGLEW